MTRQFDHPLRFDSTARNRPPWTARDPATRPRRETSYRVIAIPRLDKHSTGQFKSNSQHSLDRPAPFFCRIPANLTTSREPEDRDRPRKTRTCRDRQEFGPPSSSASTPVAIYRIPIPTIPDLASALSLARLPSLFFRASPFKEDHHTHQVAVGESTPVLPQFLTTPYPPTPQPSDHSDRLSRQLFFRLPLAPS